MAEKKSTAYAVGERVGGGVSAAARGLGGALASWVGNSALGAVPAAAANVGEFFRGAVGAQPASVAAPAAKVATARPQAYGVTTNAQGKLVSSGVPVKIDYGPAINPHPLTAEQIDAMQPAGTAVERASMTPQEKMGAYLSGVMNSPAMSLNEAKALQSMMPQTAKPAGVKDTLLANVAKQSDIMYAADIANAKTLAEGGDSAGAQALQAKATDAYFRRQASLLQVNPAEGVLAELMGQANAGGGE